MKKILRLEIALVLVTLFASCKTPTPKDLLKENLIPKPAKVLATGSSFELNSNTVIYVQKGNEELKNIAKYTANLFKPATGYNLEIKESDNKPGTGIYFTLNESSMDAEGYKMEITADMIILEASKPEGIFRAVQTIRQLLPARIESDKKQKGPWEIASGTIEDDPTYAFRGAMLDVSRHFFGVKDVKRYIDFLATYKMNVLHLHLADDQGWRIEIKSWPNLTKIGGSTQVGGGEGGFYTQEQYSEIVKYAQDRYITVIPEIDMPGHINAALASYPELNPDNKAKELYTGTEVGFSTLMTDKEITYKFIEDVIGEIAAITPGSYMHIGGDESHATDKDDYVVFINKVQEIVATHNKQMLGWADIAAAKLKNNSVAQFWQTEPVNALKAVEQNVKIIMSPAAKIYMDMQYDSLCPLGLHWAGYTELDEAYDWNPATLVEGISKENILGIEAALWTETIENMEDIEYMVFPRLPGYAELAWSDATNNSWDEYKLRLKSFAERFDYMDINYYKSPKVWGDKE